MMPKFLFIVLFYSLTVSFQYVHTALQDNNLQGTQLEAKQEDLVNQVLGNLKDFSNDLLTIRVAMQNCTDNNLKEHEATRKQIELLKLETIEIKRSLGTTTAGCPTESSISDSRRSSEQKKKAADHLLLYRPGTGKISILKNENGIFSPVYQSQGVPGSGIAGYNSRSAQDRIFALDYAQTGRQDHLVFYQPGTRTISIVKKEDKGQWRSLYNEGRGSNLQSTSDRVFPFDFNSSGMLDHLVMYLPGSGLLKIGQNLNGSFINVYTTTTGTQGFDLKSPNDRALAFDYDHSGKLDHLVLYRPGKGSIFIIKNTRGTFSAVYSQKDSGNGIGGYDLKSEADRVLAFDYDRSGKQDHLVLYRPGTGTIWILKNDNGTFKPVYQQGDPGIGIGGYDLQSPVDRVLAFDYDHSGLLDHLVLYRPGTGTIWILRNENGKFIPLYQQGAPGHGIGGYDLKSELDRVLAYDY